MLEFIRNTNIYKRCFPKHIKLLRTYTGRMVNITNLTVDDIDLKDIAHSLAGINRYIAHTDRNETVADHSIHMAKIFFELGKYKLALEALLHDATEAYIGDCPSMLKTAIPEIRHFEDTKIRPPIAEKFNLEPQVPHEVEVLDKQMVKPEIRQFFGDDREFRPIKTYGKRGETVFLNMYKRIMEKL